MLRTQCVQRRLLTLKTTQQRHCSLSEGRRKARVYLWRGVPQQVARAVGDAAHELAARPPSMAAPWRVAAKGHWAQVRQARRHNQQVAVCVVRISMAPLAAGVHMHVYVRTNTGR